MTSGRVEDRLGTEIYEAIVRSQRKRLHRRRIGIFLAVGLCFAVTLVAVAPKSVVHSSKKSRFSYSLDLGGGADDDPGSVYSDEWKVGLGQAAASLSQPLLLPHTPEVNASTIAAVYLFPKGQAVSLTFPSLDSKAPVRQTYIDIHEEPWNEGDVKSFFADDVSTDPPVGLSLCEVKGLPAECQSPDSPSDQDQANPAFLRTVINGRTEVSISGGADMDTLKSIAASLTSAT